MKGESKEKLVRACKKKHNLTGKKTVAKRLGNAGLVKMAISHGGQVEDVGKHPR